VPLNRSVRQWMVFGAVVCSILAAPALAQGSALPQAGGDVTSSDSTRYPDLPLRRDGDRGLAGAAPSGVGALVWLVIAAAAAGLWWKVRGWTRRVGADQGSGQGALLRNLFSGPGQRPLEVLHSTRLTPRASVHVLRWKGREWLVGCSDQSVTVIGEGTSSRSYALAPDTATSTGTVVSPVVRP